MADPKKLNIVIVVTYAYPFYWGGLSMVVTKQAEQLAKLGHAVTIISSNVPDSDERFERNGVVYLKMPAFDYLSKFAVPVPLFLMNKAAVSSIRTADVVHVHGMLYPSSLKGALLAKLYRKKLVLTQHAGYIQYSNKLINLVQETVKRTMGKAILMMSHKVIVVNDAVKHWIDMHPDLVETHVNGIDIEQFSPVTSEKKKALRKKFNLPLDRKLIFYNGRLVEKKGFIELFHAKSEEYDIVFVGSGDVPGYMQNIDGIHFLGVMPHDDVAEVYQLSDIFALPSFSEGFPLTIQEAMACGLPIVTTKHPGFDEYLDEKHVSYVQPERNSIKNALQELTSDEERLRSMREYSRQQAVERTSWESNVEQLLETYQSI